MNITLATMRRLSVVAATFVVCACAAAACDMPDSDDHEPEVSETESEVGLGPNGPGSLFSFSFHNGFVQQHPKVWLLFWGPLWDEDPVHKAVKSHVETVFRVLPGSHYNNILTQYGPTGQPGNYVHNDVTLLGSLLDTSVPPGNLFIGLEQEAGSTIPGEVRNAVLRARTFHGLPVNQDTQIIVFPQQGSTYSTALGYANLCAQHSWISNPTIAYGLVKWAQDDEDNCNVTFNLLGNMGLLAVRAYAEIATDPDVKKDALTGTARGRGWHTDNPPPAVGPPFLVAPGVATRCMGWEAANTVNNPVSKSPKYQELPQHGGRTFWVPMLWSTNLNERTVLGSCESVRGQEHNSSDFFPPFTGKHTLNDLIQVRYALLDPLNLGNPVTEEYRTAGGQVSYLDGGDCFGQGVVVDGRVTHSGIYHPLLGRNAFEVHGCIYLKYHAAGERNGPLAFPITDELDVPDGQGASIGRVSLFRGKSCPTGIGNSAIYYSGLTGAHIVEGCSRDTYELTGGPRFFGFPVTDELPLSGGVVNYFAGQVCAGGGPVFGGLQTGAAVYYTPATGAHEVHGCIFQKYYARGGPAALGFPISNELGLLDGRASYFAGGPAGRCGTGGPQGSGAAVYYTNINGIGARSVQGCIHTRHSEHGGPNGHLGYPTSDELPITGGRVSYFDGHGCGAERGPERSGSAIYHSAHTGSHVVQGCIYTKYWRDHGGPAGHLNFPITDEVPVADGVASYFYGNNCGPDRGPHGEGAAIFAGSHGIYTVQGCIYRKYRLPVAQGGRGGPAGNLGWPTSDEIVLANGWVSYFGGNACGAWRGPFNSGSAIYAHGTNVHNVQGCIYTKYIRDHGGPGGNLGFPVSDEIALPNGWVSYFQGNACGGWRGPFNSGSAIYAHGNNVHNVQGCIYKKYIEMSGPGGNLGLPVSNEIGLPGGWVTYFQGNACGTWRGPFSSGSAIYAHGSHVHNVQGCIYKKYIEIGGPLSSGLGFPTSDEIAGPNGWTSHFQNGYIFADGSSVRVFRF